MMDGNYHAADAYHASIVENDAQWERMVKLFPPNCEVCVESCFSPDGSWCFCGITGEWTNDPFDCVDTDCFNPTSGWFEMERCE